MSLPNDPATAVFDPLASQVIDEIERIEPPSLEAFRAEYFNRRKPVVLKLPRPEEPWSLEKLARRFSDKKVSAIRTNHGRLVGTAQQGTRFEEIRFGEVLSELIEGRRPSWHVSVPISEFPEDLRSAAPFPVYGASSAFVRSRLWLAPEGTVTPLHWDMPHNFLRPIFGRRRVLLYPALHGVFLSPNTPFSKMPNFARFEPEKPDYVTYPRARLAHPVRTILEPGEAIFIPSGWWHHIRSIETSLAVNHWFGGPLLSFAWKTGQAYKSLRGLYRGEWRSNP